MGRVDPKKILGTGRFDFSKAEQHPEWLKEARIGEHTPESIEYGISSFTFSSRRPFNVLRFEELTAVMETRANLHSSKEPTLATANSRKGNENATSLSRVLGVECSVTEEGRKAALQVVRAKGLVWLSNRRSHWQQGMASLAGRDFTIAFGSPWAAAIDSAGQPKQQRGVDGKPLWGDRRTELVVIGQDMDHVAIEKALEKCLVTEEEMAAYTEAFRNDLPYFFPSEKRLPGNQDDLEERIRRYNIEVLGPKNKKTQVLAMAPKSTEVLSAHSCIAEFTGISKALASFRVDRYLRYAHLFPELASGLVKKFEFPLATADSQTLILAEETTGSALSDAISELTAGDRIELEWRQIRVEMDTTVDEDRFSIVEQCNKLVKLDVDAEAALLKAFPQPQIMIRKLRGAPGGDRKQVQPPEPISGVVIDEKGGQEGRKKKKKKKKKKKGKKRN